MKLIFLDIDGVLNTTDHLTSLISERKEISDKFGHLFDPLAVQNLEEIVRRTGAKVVISSTWRRDGLKRMRQMFKERNINADIVGITPLFVESSRSTHYIQDDPIRGEEIEIFKMRFESTHGEVESFVIIDDNDDFLEFQMPSLVQTNEDEGLTSEKAERVIQVLGEIL